MASGTETLAGWNEFVGSLPGSHILQTWQWAQFKAMYGWRPIPKVWRDEDGHVFAAAMILERKSRVTPIGPDLKVLYIPRGPLLSWHNLSQRKLVLDDLQALAAEEKAIFIKIDPEVIIGFGLPENTSPEQTSPQNEVETDLLNRGWLYSQDQIQFRNTVWLDLTGSEADWLARMKPKTRYNLRLAAKKGVKIRQGSASDLPAVYRMYAETSVRDGFVIRPEEYYLRVWKYFLDAGMAEVLLAEADGELIAGLILFFIGDRAWYLYGMSRPLQREKMPNYLLQWEAMRRAKEHGCAQYDLWGAPDVFDESDSMWGVFRFKEGLGGEIVRFIGAWDFPSRPWLYKMYTQILPGILAKMRRRGIEKARRQVSV